MEGCGSSQQSFFMVGGVRRRVAPPVAPPIAGVSKNDSDFTVGVNSGEGGGAYPAATCQPAGWKVVTSGFGVDRR